MSPRRAANRAPAQGTLDEDEHEVERRSTSLTPIDSSQALVEMAIAKKADIDTIERLVALHERAIQKQGREEFLNDLAAFQLDNQLVSTNKKIDTTTGGGTGFKAPYASLPHLVRELQAPLAAKGFSFAWDSDVSENGQTLTATFILRHVRGHEERNHFTAPTTSNAGMSPQQKYGAAESYAKRRAMLNGLGIVTEEDGGAAIEEKEKDHEKVSADQVATLAAIVEEMGGDALKNVLQWQRVESLDQIPAHRYGHVVKELQKRRRA